MASETKPSSWSTFAALHMSLIGTYETSRPWSALIELPHLERLPDTRCEPSRLLL